MTLTAVRRAQRGKTRAAETFCGEIRSSYFVPRNSWSWSWSSFVVVIRDRFAAIPAFHPTLVIHRLFNPKVAISKAFVLGINCLAVRDSSNQR